MSVALDIDGNMEPLPGGDGKMGLPSMLKLAVALSLLPKLEEI